MRRLRKILLGCLGSLAVLVVLALGFVLAAPYLVNLEPIKEKLLHALSQYAGGKIEFKRLELSYFPRPRVKVRQVSLTIPETSEGTVESIQAYPDLLAILRGEVRVSGIEIESPRISIRLGKGPEKKEEKSKRPLLEEIREAIGQVSAVSANIPDLNAVVKNGSVELYEEARLVSSFTHFNGRIFLSGGSIRTDGSCSSNFCEKISVRADLSPADQKGQAQIDLVNFHPHALTGALLSGGPWSIEDSRIDLQLRIKAEGPRTLQAELHATTPSVSFRQGRRTAEIRGKGLKGRAQIKGDEIEVSVDELILDRPRLTLSGKFQKGGQASSVSVHVEAREVDAASAREAALAVAGEVPVVQTIFDYVRAGRIPLIIFDAKGRSVEDLGRTVNLSIKGRMEGGEVFVRPVQLRLERVRGEVAISRGILQGKNLEATIGNTKGREGTVRVGLEGDTAPFHLEMTLDADPTEVHSFLGRVVQNEGFKREFSRIDILGGSARGRLVLGESLDSIHAQVDVSAFSVSVKYRLIPFPLQITNGQFHYERGRIGLKNVAGSIGRSSFSDLTGQFAGERELTLEVGSGKLAVSLDELYPWLSSREQLRPFRENIPSARGTIRLSEVNLRGPVLRPKDWYFQAVGDMENVVVETSLVPGPIAVTSGTFRVDPERLSISNFKTKVLDSLVVVSGTFYEYTKGIEKAEIDMSGEVAQKSTEWLSDFLHFGGKTRPVTPLHISAARLSWNRGPLAVFKGDLSVKDGPQISLEILREPHHLKVEKLLIRDDGAEATAALDFQGRAVEVGFSGTLSEKTLAKILTGHPLQDGWIKGDFKARIVPEDPLRSTAQGRVDVRRLSVPWRFERPVVIDEISLEGKGNHVSVARGMLKWGDKNITLSGDVKFSEGNVFLDMDLAADRLDLEEVKEALAKGNGERGAKGRDEKKEDKKTSDEAGPEVEGRIRFKSESLTYGRFTSSPFQAELSFVPGRLHVDVTGANVCGISSTGKLDVAPKDLSLDVQTLAKNRDLNSAVHCLFEERVGMTGAFDLTAALKAQGEPDRLAQLLQGNLELTARKGRIYKFNFLSKVFSFINVTGIVKGTLPDFRDKGFAYDSIKVTANIENGKVLVKEASLQGPTMQIASVGEIDPFNKKIDMKVLVSPLGTVDSVINRIPVINKLLGGSLLSVPVRVRGELEDPRVTPLSPTAVGSDLLGIVKRTIELPVELIQPFR